MLMLYIAKQPLSVFEIIFMQCNTLYNVYISIDSE